MEVILELALIVLAVYFALKHWWVIVIIGVCIGLYYFLKAKKKHQLENTNVTNNDEYVTPKNINTDDSPRNLTSNKDNHLETANSMKTDMPVTPTIHKLRKKLYDYVVFDIETTGLDRFEDKIIQISAVKFKNDHKIDEFNMYVNPHKMLDQKIIFLTGITNSDLEDAVEIETALNRFSNFIEDSPLIGHNIFSFDIPFLIAKGLTRADIYALDTLKLAQRKLIEVENHKLPTLKRYYGITNRSHNALNDCETTAIVYQNLRDDKLDATPIDVSKISQTLAGKRVVVTGQFMQASREEIINEITDHGGKCTKTVSRLTDYLLAGSQIADNLYDGTHSRNELTAMEFIKDHGKIQIINYEQFKSILDGEIFTQEKAI